MGNITECTQLAICLCGCAGLIAFYRSVRECDCFGFTFFGKVFTLKNPLPAKSYLVAAPYIRLVNEFLHDFMNSPQKTISVTPDDVKPGSPSTPLLGALHGMDYERIRLRLRIISSLDPVVNLQAEEGTIQFTCGTEPGVFKEFKLRSRFAAKGEAILLEKL